MSENLNKTMKFSIDYFEVMHDDPHTMIISSYIVSEGSNLHDTYFSLDSINNAIPTLANKPILVVYDSDIEDFEEHARNESDEIRREQVGNVPESNKAEIVEYKGKNFLKANFIIWKKYCPHVAERFNTNSVAKISMEIEAHEYHVREDGNLSIDDWSFTGIALLGDKQMSAIPNTISEVLKFSKSDYVNIEEEMNINYSIVEEKPHEDIIVEEKIVDNTDENKNIDNQELEQEVDTISEEDEPNEIKEEFAVSKEDIGSGDKLKVSLTKKSADFETDWGTVDKTKLRNGLMLASNYKSVVPKSYLVTEEGWEEAPSQHLKFPVVMIKDGTVIYSAKGAQSALSFLEKDPNATYYKDAKAKLRKIYEKLGLSTENFAKEKEAYSLDLMDIMALLDKMLREKETDEYGFPKMMLNGCNSEFVFAYQFEDGKMFRMPYLEEEGKFRINFEDMEEVFPIIEYKLMAELSEDETKVMEMAKDVKDATGMAFALAVEKAKEVTEKEKEYIEKVEKFSEIQTNFSKISEEVEDLRLYKADVLKSEKVQKANSLYALYNGKYDDIVSEDEIKEFNEILFSFETFEDFETKFKASVLPKIEEKLLDAVNKVETKVEDKVNTAIDVNFSNLTQEQQNEVEKDVSTMSQAEKLKYVMENN